jgi:hypothetical protein
MLGWALYYLLAPQPEPKPDSPDRVVATGVSIAAALATVLLFAAVVVNPWLTAAHLGGIAVLTGFLLALALAGALLVGSAVALPAPAGLRAIGFQRTPVLALLLLWLLIASALDRGGYHDARALTDPAPVAGMSINEAWACWLGKNKLAVSPAGRHCTDEHAGTIAGPGAAVPLLLVSTSGGGIRAAYWTALVLDCALEVDVPTATANEPCSQNARSSTWERSNAVFAMSGISGGSLGLAAYNAFLAEKTAATDPGWIPKRMNADSLSASVAWWLFVEAPRAFLRYHNKDDRAAILERGWERDWAKEAPAGAGLAAGFLRLQRDHPELPLLLLNGTSVADGCRFNTSILDAGLSAPKASSDAAERCRSTQPFDGVYLTDLRPDQIATPDRAALAGTRDLLDFRCDSRSDIPLSTAALLSARFPFVSPAGRVAQDCAGKKVSYVVDGGYLETSGASPLTETAERLLPLIQSRNRRASRCIVPFLIQIDNGEAGYHNLSARPGELNVPLKTVFAARGGRAAQARNEAALLFSQRFGNATITVAGSRKKLRDRYAHFNNYAHPGPQPPLGWTLSERSREDLRAQLGQPQNVNAMNEVRSWFTAAREGRLRCE